MRWSAVLLVATLGACSSASSSGDTERSTAVLPLSIPNQGGDMEGHGPRGFAGQGVGLFAGDNLNPSFPEGDGVQIWLSFDLPVLTDPNEVGAARLGSSAMSVSGEPFGSLGSLNAEVVTYDAFDPELFDLPSDAAVPPCTSDVDAGTFECDVTAVVRAAIDDGDERIQFRLKFDELTDGDGQQDLALFFLTDSNTNEPGIFELEVS